MTPGLVQMPMAEYLADPCPTPSLSAGIAHTLITQSALHAKWAHPKLSPSYKQEEDGRFDIGTAAHSLILEGVDKVAVCEFDDWRSKAARQAREDARRNGFTPLLTKHYEAVKAMVLAAANYMASCELKAAFAQATPELTCLWQEGDLWMRARPDLTSADRKVIVNYKTTEIAEPESFARRMIGLGYDLSAVFYERGMKAIGYPVEQFFLAQEVTPPYACALVGLSDPMREIANGKLDYALTLWAHCMKTDQWSAYPSTVYYAEPKAYELDKWAGEALSRGDRKTFDHIIDIAGQG